MTGTELFSVGLVKSLELLLLMLVKNDWQSKGKLVFSLCLPFYSHDDEEGGSFMYRMKSGTWLILETTLLWTSNFLKIIFKVASRVFKQRSFHNVYRYWVSMLYTGNWYNIMYQWSVIKKRLKQRSTCSSFTKTGNKWLH